MGLSKVPFLYLLLVLCATPLVSCESGVKESPWVIVECTEPPVEQRQNAASVVLSAKVIELFKIRRQPVYSANIQIKRVFKGDGIITNIPSLKSSKLDAGGNYNKVINVLGLGNESLCNSDVMKRDTKIFFLEFEEGPMLRVCSSVLPISLYNLRLVESVAQGIELDILPPTKSPCLGHFCAFHATCLVNATSQQPYCQCEDTCIDDLVFPVCGTDGQTYSSECQLKLASCYRQRRIKVQYESVCHDPCDGVKCQGHMVCQLDSERKPMCQCETSCDPVIAPVCGSDRNTYSNQCMLRQQACALGRDITVLYHAKCSDNPCTGMKCGAYQQCVMDRLGQASCICPPPCQKVQEPVCGSDGVTYTSECELRRKACIEQARVYLDHQGACETDSEDQGPCRDFECDFDADCVVRDGRPECQCPTCLSEPYDPMCGDNGYSYEHDCERRKENCEKHQRTQVEHRGHCMDCKHDRSVCKFYSMCQNEDGLYRCVCPSDCAQSHSKVCGTDGVTYDSECELRVASCKNKDYIYLASDGDCVDCNGIQCKYGSTCVRGQCVCPQVCPKQRNPVCASDGQTYRNECDMRNQSCRFNKNLEIVHSGECVDSQISGSGEGSGSDCEDSMCEQYGGHCYIDMDGISRCACSFSCDAIRSPVCGSDGVTYGNKCELQKAGCDQQRRIVVQSMDSCDDMDEVLCDGLSPVMDTETNEPYHCTGGHDCPAGSYCHLQYGRCCNEEQLSDVYIRDCTESQYGCCEDNFTFALGPNQAGCPDQCQCSPIGSLGVTCNPTTKQCSCKPGVGGQHCDRCLPGYWGLQLIQEDENTGCIPCNCHKVGADRPDCDQSMGKCQCKSNYTGPKCGRCINSGLPATNMGCNGGTARPCGDTVCYYGATCSLHGIPHCFCDFNCPKYDFPRAGYVCASNDLTYLSECSLRKDACERQTPITIAYSGPCKHQTDVPYTPRSRKTTRHIQASNYMTPKKPSPTTRAPLHTGVDPSKYGRIDDLCLEDSYCFIPNSHCYLAICKCNKGYIPTYDNTQCSKVVEDNEEEVIPDEVNTCTLNPCLHQGVCKLDDNLGYRCLCTLGKTGNICKKSTSFTTPSFSGASYLSLQPVGNISQDFYVDIAFRTFNMDGMLLYSSQNEDGTGQFMSLAISEGYVEFRYDTGSGPKQIRHPYELTRDRFHQVIAKKMGQSAMLIVDNLEPVAAVSIATDHFQDLSGRLFLGSLPQNISFLSEKVGVNLGFVGCIQSLTAGHMDMARIYDLEYPSSSHHIVDGLDIGPCEENPCLSMPCKNGASCMMLNKDIYECLCTKGYTGSDCEAPVDICTNSPCHPSATCSLGNNGEILCHCPETREGQYCEYEKLAEIEIPEFYGDSFLVLHVADNLSTQTNIEIWFLTKSTNGMLLYASQYLGGQGDFISVNIIDRYVELRFDLGDSPVIIRSSTRLRLDKWHKVSIKRTSKEAELAIDDSMPSKGTSQGSLTGLQITGSLYIGGYKKENDLPTDAQIHEKFTGVIQRIYVNGKLIEEPISSALETYHVTQYTGPPCQMNPCMNGGVCIPRLDKVDCKCPKRYIGQLCEKVAENLETSLPVRFNTETYLQYYNEITSSVQAQKINKYQFRFRTHQMNGLMIFQGQGPTASSDYIALAISNGYVELGYNLGKQSADNLLRARSSVYVSDGEWHTVYAERDHRRGSLQVDKESIVTTISESGATQLDTDGMLWIGGRSDLPVGLPEDYYRGFKGCLGFVFILDKHLHLYDHRNGLGSIMEFCH